MNGEKCSAKPGPKRGWRRVCGSEGYSSRGPRVQALWKWDSTNYLKSNTAHTVTSFSGTFRTPFSTSPWSRCSSWSGRSGTVRTLASISTAMTMCLPTRPIWSNISKASRTTTVTNTFLPVIWFRTWGPLDHKTANITSQFRCRSPHPTPPTVVAEASSCLDTPLWSYTRRPSPLPYSPSMMCTWGCVWPKQDSDLRPTWPYRQRDWPSVGK